MPSEKRFTDIMALGERLAQARIRLNLSQEALAEAVGTTTRSIRRWEHNQATPQPYYLDRLFEVLQMTPEHFRGLTTIEQQNTTLSEVAPLWHVPYTRNPYFIGREAILCQLHERLHVEHQVILTQPHILSGLGGIGKTQTVLEYAYRFRSDYQAVLWVGAETTETLMADYLALAQLFQLPEKDNANQVLVSLAVKRWFQRHVNWLLVFDNVEDLDLLHKMLPDTSQGHILITTRSQITGVLGSHLDLQQMETTEGSLFLLRRAKLIGTDTPLEDAPDFLRVQAETLVNLLDGLPLALDQAAAYIEETACSLSDYLEHYATHQKDLLSHRGTLCSHHPASVTATLSLALQQVERASPVAADLLRVCAFLHAEAIPEEFFTQHGQAFGPVLQLLSANPLSLDAALRDLRRFSLLHREQEARTLSIHRLLQAIIRDGMDEEDCKQWMDRIIREMLQIFPAYDNTRYDGREVHSRCQRYLSHALLCTTYIEKWNITSLEAGELFYRVGGCLVHLWGDYVQAKPLLLRALNLIKKIVGIEHATVANYLYGLAFLNANVGQYMQAEEYFRQSLTIREKLKGPDHPEVAQSLWSLGGLTNHMGRYSQAASLAKRAIKISEQALGPHHYQVALALNVLGWSYTQLGEYAQAESLLLRAKSIYEQALGGEHSLNVTSLKNLAYLYSMQGYHDRAVTFYQKALQLTEQHLRPEHTLIAILLNELGNVYFAQKHYGHAQRCQQRAAKIFEKFPPEVGSFFAAYPYLDLGELYYVQGHCHLAKRSLQQAFVILGVPTQIEQVDHQEITRCFLLAGDLLTTRCELMDAYTYYQRALVIGMQRLGSSHPLTQRCRSNVEVLSALAHSE